MKPPKTMECDGGSVHNCTSFHRGQESLRWGRVNGKGNSDEREDELRGKRGEPRRESDEG